MAFAKRLGITGIASGKHAIFSRRHWVRHGRFHRFRPTVQAVCNAENSVMMELLQIVSTLAHLRAPTASAVGNNISHERSP